MFGRAADLESILDLGVPIVEDCATSIGSGYRGKKLGSFGRLAVFSFYATKVLCAGEGGAVATSDAQLAEHLRDLRDYDGRRDGSTRYNYKLTDLQAAVGRVQLGKLDQFVERRREMGSQYARALESTDAQVPRFGPGEYPYRFVIRHASGADVLIPRFESAGAAARRPVFWPLHRSLGVPDNEFPCASEAYQDAISLPLYPAMSEVEVDQLLRAAHDILQAG
jgi:dTDP-4-amino-4,6-dideoxygalactose transaminase